MLVLGRRAGESILIDGQIRVTIVSVDGDRVRVGIDAPRSVPIVRQEVYDAVRAENLAAASGADPGGLRRLVAAIRPDAE